MKKRLIEERLLESMSVVQFKALFTLKFHLLLIRISMHALQLHNNDKYVLKMYYVSKINHFRNNAK